jgi:DNA invertase Pin-like site-specific DNA recombinase
MASGGKWWRGKYALPQHASDLVRQFFLIVNDRKMPLREIAKEAGLSYATIQAWQGKNNPNIIIFQAALNVLGYELCIRKRETPA